MAAPSMDLMVSLCKRRGFVFPSSEIYGGFASTWDYGPLGAELKRNLKQAWWRRVVWERPDVEGLDAAILMSPQVWVASGHVSSFSDPLVECKGCHHRFRADTLEGPNCPNCGSAELTEPRQFNMMFKTFVGPVEEDAAVAYLRPETCQGIFVNFDNVLNSARPTPKLPFGIAQIGKAFRNEIVTGNFTFRTREFEQFELEYFVHPEQAEAMLQEWLQERLRWYTDLGIDPEHLRLREHEEKELAHYAARCYDIEYRFPDPLGWRELEGIANRTDYDLRKHSEYSGHPLRYFDDSSGEYVDPYVIEPSGGVDRALLIFLLDAYHEEEVRGRKRVVLRLHPLLAPIKVAVFPLKRNQPELVEMAQDLARQLRPHMRTIYEETGAIGRLYRRMDEVGTPYCVTVDFDSLKGQTVTVRERDSMEQERVHVQDLLGYLRKKITW
ncbi:MAG: glycine--tRNA ligase [Chloroflexia bacterium]|nr:glycine--tRNA ligase [Chloroflexia bacterium]